MMMNFLNKNWQKMILFVFVFSLPFISLADTSGPVTDPNAQGKIINPLSTTNSLPGFIENILTGAIKIGIPIIALAIIYCGFLFVFARGNSEKLGHAKDALLYTLIGAAILLGALAIAQMISATVLSLG
jgi:hypothetical protein